MADLPAPRSQPSSPSRRAADKPTTEPSPALPSQSTCLLCHGTGIVPSPHGPAHDPFFRLWDCERLAESNVFCTCAWGLAKREAVRMRERAEVALAESVEKQTQDWFEGADERLLARIGLPAAYWGYTHATYLELAGEEESKLAALALTQTLAHTAQIRSPHMSKAWPGLLLYGPDGVGKTGCLVPLLLRYAQCGVPVRYVEYADLLTDWTAAELLGSLDEYLDGLAACGAVMIRNFGVRGERPSEQEQAILIALLDLLRIEDVRLLVTSPLSPYEIDDLFGGVVSSLLTTYAYAHAVSGPPLKGSR